MDKTPQDVILSGFLPSLVHRSRPTYISSSIIRSHSISVCHMIISLPIESWEAIINAVHSSHISPFVWLQQHSLGVSIIFYNGFLNRRRVFEGRYIDTLFLFVSLYFFHSRLSISSFRTFGRSAYYYYLIQGVVKCFDLNIFISCLLSTTPDSRIQQPRN